jgi:hypothetical protein
MTKEQAGVLTMVIINGIFMVGKMIGGNKLTKPRIFSIIKDGKEIMMQPLPRTPTFIRIGIEACSYSVPDRMENKNIFDLYERVTNPSVDPGA